MTRPSAATSSWATGTMTVSTKVKLATISSRMLGWTSHAFVSMPIAAGRPARVATTIRRAGAPVESNMSAGSPPSVVSVAGPIPGPSLKAAARASSDVRPATTRQSGSHRAQRPIGSSDADHDLAITESANATHRQAVEVRLFGIPPRSRHLQGERATLFPGDEVAVAVDRGRQQFDLREDRVQQRWIEDVGRLAEREGHQIAGVDPHDVDPAPVTPVRSVARRIESNAAVDLRKDAVGQLPPVRRPGDLGDRVLERVELLRRRRTGSSGAPRTPNSPGRRPRRSTATRARWTGRPRATSRESAGSRTTPRSAPTPPGATRDGPIVDRHGSQRGGHDPLAGAG